MLFPAKNWRISLLNPIEITTIVPCPVRCNYCPQDVLLKTNGIDLLSLSDFKRYLKMINPERAIHFSGFSEPFANRDCAEMIEYALRIKRKIKVFTRFSLCDNNDIRVLNRLPAFSIYFHYNLKGNKKIHLIKKNQNIIFIGVKEVPSPEGWNKIFQDIISRSGNLGWQETDRYFRALGCSDNRELQSVVLPNGKVAICCMDYSLTTIIGNLNDETHDSMFCGEVFKKFIVKRKEGKTKLCNKCFRGTR
jgi:sulfatase maturation enzyme AslB (radical SAM superfamily)